MTVTENTALPVIEVPPKDEISTQSAPVNTTTAATATGVNAAGPKVTPVQRLSTVYRKAKQTMTDAVTEAQKALNEKKHTQSSANAPTTGTDAARETSNVAIESTAPAEKKTANGFNTTFKDLLNRVKELSKPISSQSTTTASTTPNQLVHSTATGASTDKSTAPVPPPKDNVESSTSSNMNPLLDQLKRNSTLLSNYFGQKKKEFTEKMTSETTTTNNNERYHLAPEEVHVNNIQSPAVTTGTTTGEKAPASPLVRRITHLVRTATTTISKKKDQLKKQNQTVGETTTTTAPAGVTTAESPTGVGATA